MSGQLHAASSLPLGKDLDGRLGGSQRQSGCHGEYKKKKNPFSDPTRNQILATQAIA